MPPIPYCGTPPVPGGATWNLDPVLIAVLLAGGVAALAATRRHGAVRLGAVTGGWLVLALALLSPLCSLSVALFSARVGQHMLMTLVAAPLLVFGLGRTALMARPGGPALPGALFALALWAWHLPGPYVATFASDVTYWTMHVTLFGSAVWLWAALQAHAEARPEAAGLAGLATAVQMGLLGALLTLAPRAIFLAAHPAAVTQPWGLSPLEDQQFGGLLMWVPGGLLFAVVCVAGLGLALRRVQRPGAAAATLRGPG